MENKLLALSFLYSIETIVFSVVALSLYYYFKGLAFNYIKYWAASLGCLAVYTVAKSVQSFFYSYSPVTSVQIITTVFAHIGLYSYLYFLLMGVYSTKVKFHINAQAMRLTFFATIVFSVITALAYSADVQSVFNRFYLRTSLPDLIQGCAYMMIAVFLFTKPKLHFSGRYLMGVSFVGGFIYIVSSFLSITMLTQHWFMQFLSLGVYFHFGITTLLACTMLMWILGAERNAANVAINKAQYLGKHDPLTGALNRDQVMQLLPNVMEKVLSHQQKLAIFLIDLKRFKFVNDTYGLKTGDYILGEAANRLKHSLLLPQVIGRISGDSFIYALEINEDSQLEKAASHLHGLIERTYQIKHQEVHLQCSVGYSVFPNDGEDAEDLLQKANLALFHAESNNIESVKYTDGMQSQGRYLLSVEKEIKRALTNNEFVLFFQPQLNLLTNKLDGAEALVRWQHPERGLLTPDAFLKDIETLGFSSEFDKYILNLACQTNDTWFKEHNRRITIAVNITAVEFQDPKFVATIQSLLFKYDILPKHLELEITENVVITDIKTAMNTIVVLQNMGIKVSIDDFGTGYSSLAYLRELPIDKIKIDRSFIKDFAANDSDFTIVKSMIKLSHGLGKRVLAEGVETVEQLNFLRSLGCDAIQGYYISRPLNNHEFSKYLTRK